MIAREGSISIYDTTVGVWEETVDESMGEVLHAVTEHLECRGFQMGPDAETEKHFRSLSKDHREGRHGELQVKVRLSGRHLEIQFFQNVVTENPNGGYYDFSKLTKMRRASNELWVRCLARMCGLVRFLASLGYELQEKNGFGHVRVDPSPLRVRDLAEAVAVAAVAEERKLRERSEEQRSRLLKLEMERDRLQKRADKAEQRFKDALDCIRATIDQVGGGNDTAAVLTELLEGLREDDVANGQ